MDQASQGTPYNGLPEDEVSKGMYMHVSGMQIFGKTLSCCYWTAPYRQIFQLQLVLCTMHT